MSILFYIGLILFAFLGGFIQTVVGFGAAVVMLIYLTNFMPISSAPSVCAVVCLVLNFSLVLQFRKAIRVRPILVPMLIYSGVSLIVVFFIKSVQISALSILFGVFLICLALYYLFLSGKLRIKDSGTGMMLASSSISGLFAGLFSIGGPTLSIYYLALCGSGDFFIASLQLSFLLTNVVLIFGRIAGGLLTADMIPAIAVGLAGALAGQLVGRRVRSRLSTKLLAKLVYAAVGVSGLIVILQHI